MARIESVHYGLCDGTQLGQPACAVLLRSSLSAVARIRLAIDSALVDCTLSSAARVYCRLGITAEHECALPRGHQSLKRTCSRCRVRRLTGGCLTTLFSCVQYYLRVPQLVMKDDMQWTYLRSRPPHRNFFIWDRSVCSARCCGD